MPETDAAPAPRSTSEPAPPEVVHRPEAGTLARGHWEAPAWAFYGASGLVVVAAAVYAVLRTPRWRRRAPKRLSPHAK